MEEHINFDLSRSDVENIFAGFLIGAINLPPGVRVMDLNALPPECRKLVRAAAASGRPWAAWSTNEGTVALWGDYHMESSKRLHAYLLLVEWYDEYLGHHSLWCYCDPKRLTEWTVGRVRP